MKYLKYIVGIIAILLVVFILIGLIKPELTYECEIMVEKPLAESWAVAQDPKKMSEWLPGFQKIEHVSGTPGTVGAVSDVYFDEGGETMTIRETITEIEPEESISMSYTSEFMDMDYKLAMSGVNDKTRINSSTTASGNGMMSKSIMALMGGAVKAQEETNLTNLKETIEKNTKNYFPVVEEFIEAKEDK